MNVVEVMVLFCSNGLFWVILSISLPIFVGFVRMRVL